MLPSIKRPFSPDDQRSQLRPVATSKKLSRRRLAFGPVALSRQVRRTGGWIRFKWPLRLPYPVQKHREFSRHGHDRFPLAAFPAAFG